MDTEHPHDPQSNVHKFSGYHPDKYALGNVSLTVRTDESVIPQRPPCLTQQTIGMYLQPLTRQLAEIAPRPTIDDLPDAVIDKMVQKDKAFWVDKPGANAYVLHDAYYDYEMITETARPPHQDVFPRSYQLDLDYVKYRRFHACDGLKDKQKKIPLSPYCRDCKMAHQIKLPGVLDDKDGDSVRERWRYYPNLNTKLPADKIRQLMENYGKPYKHEACLWYYKRYPPQKYEGIIRKFSK
ncbi:uncharacterized protein [Battus philenor]|uniref:uncharacterized protein n=1 Tax=Battus philenor TaxID=42288 RepID=UPI0035D12724